MRGAVEFLDLIPPMAKAGVLAFLGIGGFESLKFLLFPGISPGASLALTLLLVTIASGIIAYRVAQRQGRLQREIVAERRLSLEAEENLCHWRKRIGLPFPPGQPEAFSSSRL